MKMLEALLGGSLSGITFLNISR